MRRFFAREEAPPAWLVLVGYCAEIRFRVHAQASLLSPGMVSVALQLDVIERAYIILQIGGCRVFARKKR